MEYLHPRNTSQLNYMLAMYLVQVPAPIRGIITRYLIFYPKINDRVMALDITGKWLPAKILRINAYGVKVHYLRWSQFYDVSVAFSKHFIRPMLKPSIRIVGCSRKSSGTLTANQAKVFDLLLKYGVPLPDAHLAINAFEKGENLDLLKCLAFVNDV